VKITADTNLLVRVLTGDDERQAAIAKAELAGAELVAITLPTLCELSWVLIRGYKHPAAEVSRAVRRLLDAGGDFADGVIAFEGRRLGADVLVSFDATAGQLVSAQGEAARLLY
jgi:predicted nucleic-acid-binding protein